MGDDERIERLTELARRAFAEQGVHVSVEESGSGYLYGLVTTRTRDNIVNTPVKIVHPRAVDALEAALLVLCEYVTIREVRYAGCPRSVDRTWVEQLAAGWDATVEGARATGHEALADAYADCAAELRARAKGGER